MESTINCSRVPILQATIPNGTPVESGLAPATTGLDSENVLYETHDEVASNLSGRATSDSDEDRPTTPPSKTSYVVPTSMS